MDFSSEARVRVPMVQCYQHDGDYDKCACRQRKFKADRLCGTCREAEG